MYMLTKKQIRCAIIFTIMDATIQATILATEYVIIKGKNTEQKKIIAVKLKFNSGKNIMFKVTETTHPRISKPRQPYVYTTTLSQYTKRS